LSDLPRSSLVGARTVSLVAVAGLVAAVGFAVAGPDRRTVEYAVRGDPSGGETLVAPLAVAGLNPHRLVVELPCDAPGSSFRSARATELFEVSAAFEPPSTLRLPPIPGVVTAVVGNEAVFVEHDGTRLLEVARPSGAECVARLSYESSRWQLTVPGATRQVVGPAPWVSEANVEGPAARDSGTIVRVWADELGTSPSALQVG